MKRYILHNKTVDRSIWDALRMCISLVLFLLFITQSLSYTSAAVAEKSYVKVGLRYGSSAPYECTLYSESGFILGTVDNTGFNEGMPLPGYNRLSISISGRYPVIYADGVLISNDFSGNSSVMPYSFSEGGLTSYENKLYRGGFIFAVNSNNTLSVINCIGIEEYLYGVLSGEMGRSSPQEALKAQAVAARSYALCGVGSHSDSGFDFCTTTHCQMYCGKSCEYSETNNAVDETAGQIILYQEQPVSGYYYKNSGGYTQNSEDVWNNSRGYLRSVKDTYSPEYPWYWKASFQDIRSALSASGNDPGEIRQISVTKRHQYGYVGEIMISGSGGRLTLSKEQIRAVFGFTNVKSLNFALDNTVPAVGSAGTANSAKTNNAAATEIYASNGDGAVKLSGKVSVLSANGKAVDTRVSELSVLSGNSDAQKIADNSYVDSDPSQTVTLVESVTSGPVVFRGYGFGHGVGMPQDSAIEMAKQGFDYKSILQHFYTDVKISGA